MKFHGVVFGVGAMFQVLRVDQWFWFSIPVQIFVLSISRNLFLSKRIIFFELSCWRKNNFWWEVEDVLRQIYWEYFLWILMKLSPQNVSSKFYRYSCKLFKLNWRIGTRNHRLCLTIKFCTETRICLKNIL